MHRVHAIPGGIHPAENKSQSLGKGIQQLPLPKLLVLPLSQHIGAPAEPLVEVGEQVLKGQKIAAGKGFVSAPVHAPTSGTVIAIGPHSVPHPSGMSATCITIEADGRDEWIPHTGVADYTTLDKVHLLELVRNAGIVGMGGAGFPSAVKLATDKPITTLIINGTECEPYITADDTLMQERAAQIIAGTQVLRHLISPGETLIGIEDNKPQAIEIMREAAAGSGIDIISFPTKYPSGGEKQLIQILTGKEVPSGGLPADIGIVMQNVGTAAAVYNAVVHGEPLISRVTTLTGFAFGQPGNYEVLLGTPIQHLLDCCGFDADAAGRLIMGGPMMGFALDATDIPIVKTSNCILAPSKQELPAAAPAMACIRCGMCAEVCPASLLPQQLYWFARGHEHEKLEAHNLFDCIECGCCSYVCPSNIPLVQYYRASKAQITKKRRDNERSEIAKARFEKRQQRLDHEKAQKEAKRKARSERAKQAAASGSDPKEDVVAAAIARSEAKKVAREPGQAAIERAQAARSGTAVAESPADKIAKLEQRLAKAQEKYAQAQAQGHAQLAAFAASVNTLQQKLDSAKAELPAAAEHAPALSSAPTNGDPAQAAIERAQSARAGGKPDATPQEKVARLEQRLAAAITKRELAKEQDSEHLPAFAASVAVLQEKLAAAKAELPAAEPTAGNAAAAAIERAMAKRAAQTTPETPEQKLAKLEQRLAAAREKLATAQADGSEHLEAFVASVGKMEEKVAQARQNLTEQANKD
jgi:electron transport complex protein RnfC